MSVGTLVSSQLAKLGSQREEGLCKVEKKMEDTHLATSVQLNNIKARPDVCEEEHEQLRDSFAQLPEKLDAQTKAFVDVQASDRQQLLRPRED